MSDVQGWATDGDGEIDLTGIDPNGPPPLDDGVYEVEIVEAHAQGSKPKDGKPPTPGFSMKLQVTRVAGGIEGSMKRTLFDNVYVTAESAFRVVQLKTALGLEAGGRFSTSFEGISAFCAEILGGRMYVRTKQDEYPKGSGKLRARVQAYLTEAMAIEAAAGVTVDSRPTRAQLAAQRAAAE